MMRAVLTAGLLMAVASAQAAAVDRVGTRVPVEFRSWKVENPGGGEETISQFHVPLAVTFELAQATHLVVATSGGSSRMTESGVGDRTLGGFSDTEIQIYQNVPRASLLLFAGVQLPSGVRALSPDEIEVTRRIANPILGMSVRQYGRGLDVNVGAVWSHLLRERTRFSFGAHARFCGAYEVAEGIADLEPGHQAAVTVDLLWKNEEWERLRRSVGLSASVRVFGSDEQAGEVVFEEGTEVRLEGRATLPLRGADWQTQVSAVLKEDNTSYDRSGTLLLPRPLASGTGIWLDSSVLVPWGRSSGIGPEVRARSFDGNGIENGDGWALELGPLLSLAVGAENRIDLRGAFLLGRMGKGAETYDLSGFAVGLGTSWRLR